MDSAYFTKRIQDGSIVSEFGHVTVTDVDFVVGKRLSHAIGFFKSAEDQIFGEIICSYALWT